MARRKSKPKRRRDTALSLTGTAEAIMLANVGTRAAFNLSAWDWVTDGWTAASSGSATGAGQLSLHEMIYGNQSYITPFTIYTPGGQPTSGGGLTSVTTPNMDIVVENIKQNWAPALIQSVAIPVGFRVGKKLLRRPIAMGNKLLKQAGLRSMVKI